GGLGRVMIEQMRAERLAKSKLKKETRKLADEPAVCKENTGLRDLVYIILLGETKYFKATICSEKRSLVIDTTTDGGHTPALGDGISSVSWGSVESVIDTQVSSGHRLGTYWEVAKSVDGLSLQVPDMDGNSVTLP